MTLEEMKWMKLNLENECAELDKQIKEAEEKILSEKKESVQGKLTGLTAEQRTCILSYFKHTCQTCTDKFPSYNGYNFATGTYRCPRCMAIQMMDGGVYGAWDFHIEIERVK